MDTGAGDYAISASEAAFSVGFLRIDSGNPSTSLAPFVHFDLIPLSGDGCGQVAAVLSRTNPTFQEGALKNFVTPVLVVAAITGLTLAAAADGTYQTLPFSQDWNNVGQITVDDNWSGVPGIIGYRGDSNNVPAGTDPQTVTVDDIPANTGVATSPVVDVNANKTAADFTLFFSGGVTEWEITDPVVALNGSGTADAPYLQFHIDSQGFFDITVAYELRDIEDFGTDNSVQQFALQYRTSTSGSWTNVPLGYVADASAGPALPLVTPVLAVLPPDANEQPTLQIRIITTNALGNDEWVGPDNISITGTPAQVPVNTSTWGSVKARFK
jgi:uncharacterized protein